LQFFFFLKEKNYSFNKEKVCFAFSVNNLVLSILLQKNVLTCVNEKETVILRAIGSDFFENCPNNSLFWRSIDNDFYRKFAFESENIQT